MFTSRLDRIVRPFIQKQAKWNVFPRYGIATTTSTKEGSMQDLLLEFNVSDGERVCTKKSRMGYDIEVTRYHQPRFEPDIMQLSFSSQPNIVQSLHQLDMPKRLFLPYQLDMMTAFSIRDIKTAPMKILVVGLGAGSLPLHLRALYPDSHITALDLDEDLIDISKEYYGMMEDECMDLRMQEGLNFIRDVIKHQQLNGIKGTYDVIIQDAQNSIPGALVSIEAQKMFYDALKPDGLFLQNIFCRHASQAAVIASTQYLFQTVCCISSQPDKDDEDSVGTTLGVTSNPNVIVAGLKHDENKKVLLEEDDLFDRAIVMVENGWLTEAALINIGNIMDFTNIDLKTSPFHLVD